MKHMLIVLSSMCLALGCSSESRPSVASLTGPSSLLLQARGATTDHEEFQAPVNIPAPSPCLGGTFQITGVITGWARTVQTPDGHIHSTEHIDFSALRATLGSDLWTARPGSHEIWSTTLPPAGDAAGVVVHEGRTRFVSSTGAPDVLFVHRIHRLVRPSGQLQFNRVTFEALCQGPAL